VRNKGYKLTEEHKVNISNGIKNHLPSTVFKNGHIPWLKGKKVKCNTGRTHFKKGSIPWNKGKRWLQVSGANSNFWKGGINPLRGQVRSSFKYRQWRSDVFTRDNFTCQTCGKRGGDLEAHHLREFAIIIFENKIKTLDQALTCEELWNINNGQTLCVECHDLTKKGRI